MAKIDIVVVAIISIIYALLNIFFRFIDEIYRFSRKYIGSTTVEFIANFIFLLLAGFLLITYRRWRQGQTRQKELENLLESIMPQVYLVLAPDNEIVECNAFVKAMFGYEREEVIGHKANFLYAEDRSQRDQHEVSKILEEEEGFHIGRGTGKKKDGTEIPLEITTGGLKDSRGSVVVLHKITDKASKVDASPT